MCLRGMIFFYFILFLWYLQSFFSTYLTTQYPGLDRFFNTIKIRIAYYFPNLKGCISPRKVDRLLTINNWGILRRAVLGLIEGGKQKKEWLADESQPSEYQHAKM